MNKKILSRILIDVLIAISLLSGGWFVALPLCMLGSYAFSYFIEAIVAGIVYDSLFGLIFGMGVRAFAGTISMVVLSLLSAGLKTVLRKG